MKNNRGNGLLSAIVGMTILTIGMNATLHLMAYQAKAQNKVSRLEEWNTFKNNVMLMLGNSAAVSNTLKTGVLTQANNVTFAKVGTHLNNTLTIQAIVITSLGSGQYSLTVTAQDLFSHNYMYTQFLNDPNYTASVSTTPSPSPNITPSPTPSPNITPTPSPSSTPNPSPSPSCIPIKEDGKSANYKMNCN